MTNPDVQVTLALFDSRHPTYRCIREAVPIGDFTPVSHNDYAPAGGTPLRDATGGFIGHLEQLRSPGHVTIGMLLDESGSMGGNRDEVIEGVNHFIDGMRNVENVNAEQDGTVLAVIVTDGHENASQEVTQEALQAMISEREGNGWTFIFMGSNHDAWDAGRSYGFSGNAHAHTVSYAGTPQGTAAVMDSVSSESVNYLTSTPAQFAAASSGRSSRSITEDGQETLTNINAAQGRPDPADIVAQKTSMQRPGFGNPEDALKAARKATS